MSLLKILFSILILIFPLGEIARFELGNGVTVTLNDILVGLFVIFCVIKDSPCVARRLLLFKPIVYFAVIAALSLLVNIKTLNSSEFFVSSLYLLRWIIYAGIYFSVFSFDASFKQFIRLLLIISGAIVVLGGYTQYFFYPALRNLIYLGWDEHLYRMFSSFFDPNFAGIFFVLYFIFILALFIQQNRKIKLVLIVILILTTGAIFLTYSRSALFSFFAGIIIFLFNNNKKKFIIPFLAISVFAIFLLPRSFKTEGTDLFRSVSAMARINSSQNAITIFKDSPIFGVGFNAYRYAQYRYGFIKKSESQVSHAGAGTDNSFLFVLATTGVLGFIAYMFLWYEILKQSARGGQNDKKTILFPSIIAIFVSAFFINSLFYPFLMEWIWVVLALKENK